MITPSGYGLEPGDYTLVVQARYPASGCASTWYFGASAPLGLRVGNTLDGVAPGMVVEGASFRVYSRTWTEGASGVVFIDDDTGDANPPLAYEGIVQPGGYIEITPDPLDLPAIGTYWFVSVADDLDGTARSVWLNALQVEHAGDAGSPLVVAIEEDVSCGGAGTECAHPILPGQTWQGEWGEPGDIDYFSFTAGAGTDVAVTLDRVDLTLPPQHPDAPAPEVLLVRPDGIVFAASDPLPLDGTGTSLASSLTMGGTHQIAVRTPKGLGQYVVTLITTAEGGSGDVVFGQTSERTHLTTALSPETTLKVPLLDPFGNPLAGGKVEWESGDDCGDGTFCGTGQTTTWRTSLAGVALNPVTPQTGGTPLWQARSAQQELSKALQPIDRPGVTERVLAARHVEPMLGFVSSHGRAVGSSQLPDLATAAAMKAEARLRAEARPMAGVKGGPLCGSHSLTCPADEEPVFRAVRLDVQPDEELVSVEVRILEGGTPIEELDGHEVLSTVGLTLEASARVRDGGGIERDIPITDPVRVSVYGDQGGGVSQLGRSCDQMEVAAGAFDYLVGINSAHQFQYEDEFGEPCCWMPTEVVHASVVAEMEVDDGQGGATRVFREAETVVKSIPRPADPCEVRTLESGVPSFAGYPFVEVGTAYLTDACGNIVYGVGLADSEDHNQPGDEFRVVAPVGPVWATARSDGNHWSYSVLLNGDVGEPGTIPDGGYTVDFEVASQSPECSAGGVITGSYTVSIADDTPQVVLWWDWEWDAQNSPRGPEPDDQLISPGSAVRDASGAVAVWRVPAFDGAADSHFFAGSYSNVPVKLYVAWYGSITFDPDGSPEPSYLEPVEGVELCTGVVEKLTDAAGHLGYNSPVRTTCDTPWATFATAGASSDPVDTPETPAGPPDTWIPVGLGIGVTKGPEQPGRYVLVAEPLDPAFRRGDAWRVMSPFLPDGFVDFEVGGGMFLDEDYRPLPEDALVDNGRTVYLKLGDAGMGVPQLEVDITTEASDGTTVDSILGLELLRSGVSSTYISGPIGLLPPWETTAKVLDGDQQTIRVPDPVGTVKAQRSLAEVATNRLRTHDPYEVLVGLRKELAVNWFETELGKFHYICSYSDETCICPNDDPDCLSQVVSGDIVWSVDPSVPEDLVARFETESDGDYLRAMRKSEGRTPDGKLAVKAAFGGQVLETGAIAARPEHLGCCATGTCLCTTTYSSDPVDLEQRAIDVADQHGIPPQLLMAMMALEAGPGIVPGQLNSYAFRYELDTDFERWTGDSPGVASDDKRHLFHAGKAGPNLGVDNGAGEAEFMACWDAGSGAPCSVHDYPDPVFDPVRLVPAGGGGPPAAVWKVVTDSDPPEPIDDLYLQMSIEDWSDPGSPVILQQKYPGDGEPVGALQYKVHGRDGTVTFGEPWTDVSSLSVYARRAIVNRLSSGSVPSWGANVPDVANIIASNPPGNVLPPPALYQTIGDWALARTSNPIATDPPQVTSRYDREFSGDAYWELVKIDNAYRVQGQWFMAASYGLMQLIPETVRTVIASQPPAHQPPLLAVYDPRTNSPEILFDPEEAMRFGVLVVERDKSTPEANKLEGEVDCPVAPNECTWTRVWRRRLRVFNTGDEDVLPRNSYDDRVFDLAGQMTPSN